MLALKPIDLLFSHIASYVDRPVLNLGNSKPRVSDYELT